MTYISGEDRSQAALLPAAIEDNVAADAPVRVIDAFVSGLDARGLGFERSVPAATGRPPSDPRDLLGRVDTYRSHKMMAARVTTSSVISGGLFEAGCDATELLELAEAAFHEMTLGIQMLVERIFVRP